MSAENNAEADREVEGRRDEERCWSSSTSAAGPGLVSDEARLTVTVHKDTLRLSDSLLF